MNLFAGQEWRHRCREWTWEQIRGRRGWGEWREQHRHIYAAVCKPDAREKLLFTQEPSLVPDGGPGVQVGGRLKKEGIHVYLGPIHLAVQQKPTQHSKAITLQVKIHFKKSSPHSSGNFWRLTCSVSWLEGWCHKCVYIYIYLFIKTHWIVHLRPVHFTV